MQRPSIQVLAPTFEQHHDGFGVQFERPRVSWRFACADENVRDWEQCAYELEFGHDEAKDQTKCVHVESQQSTLVPWPSEISSLRSGERRWVRVRCYGTSIESGNAVDIAITEWSEWSVVEAAILHRQEWSAKMIVPVDKFTLNENGSVRPLYFRKCFSLPENKHLSRARLYITSHGTYHTRINGEDVGNNRMAPGWQSYDKRMHYQVFDVLKLLDQRSENVIGVEVGPGWFASALSWANLRFRYGDDLGLLAQLELEFDDTSSLTIDSNSSWRCNVGPIVSSEIYDGETFDQSLITSMNGWDTFASFSDQTWRPTKVSTGRVAPLSAPNGPPVRVTQRVTPTKVFASDSGKTIIDFGQNLVGRLRIKRLRQPAGHRVVFRHAEVMENGELGTRPLRGAKATDTIICDGNLLTDWSPRFTFHGFRYVEVTGWSKEDQHEPLTMNSLFAEVMHSDMKRTGWFSCSNDKVNKLHENAVWSMRGNFLSVPTDCPQRDERLGWSGDLNIFTPSANFLYDTAGLLGNWLEDLYADQMDDSPFWRKGVVPFVIPNCVRKKKTDDPFWDPTPEAVWADVAVMTPWTLFNASGDREILVRQYDSMSAYLDKGIQRGDDDLWDPWQWQFGDWLDPAAPTNDSGKALTDGTYVADAFLVKVTQLMAQTAAILDRQKDALRYQKDFERLKKRFQTKYLTAFGLVVCDTQTALSLALVFNLIDDPVQRENAAVRLGRAVRLNDFRIGTGFAGTPFVPHALSGTGQVDLAYRMLLEENCPSWLYPVTMGATTIWERWDSMLPDGSINPGSMTSFNHYALGSVVNWLHECVGGVSALEPGWKMILVRPCPNREFSHAEVALESPYGRVECRWVLKGQVFKLYLLVPPNSKAIVILPDNQQPKLVKSEQEKSQTVGSGRHVFECRVANSNWPPQSLPTAPGI